MVIEKILQSGRATKVSQIKIPNEGNKIEDICDGNDKSPRIKKIKFGQAPLVHQKSEQE